MSESMIQAQIKISRWYRKHSLIQNRKNGIFLQKLYYDEKPYSKVYIAVNTIEPEWKKYEMIYSQQFKMFYIDLKLTVASQFKFYVDNSQIPKISKSYPVLTDDEGKQANIFLPKQKQKHGPLSYSRSSKKDVLNSENASKVQSNSTFSVCETCREASLGQQQKNNQSEDQQTVLNKTETKQEKKRCAGDLLSSFLPKKGKALLFSEENKSDVSEEDFFFSGELLQQAKSKKSSLSKKFKKDKKKTGMYQQKVEPSEDEQFFDDISYSQNHLFGNQQASFDEIFEFEAAGIKLSKYIEQEQCEDAFFTHQRGIGVADGVGSWQKYGISPAEFANELMNSCKKCVEDQIEQKAQEYKDKHLIKRRSSQQNLLQYKRSINLHKLEKSSSKYLNEKQKSIKLQVLDLDFDAGNDLLDQFEEDSIKLKINKERKLKCQLSQMSSKKKRDHSSDNESIEILELSIASSISLNSNEQKYCEMDPIQIVTKSYQNTKNCGSSTCVLGIINKKILNISNLGDSGFLIIRNAGVEQSSSHQFPYNPFILLKSKPQQHTFNTPYQLTNMPKDDQMQRIKSNLPEQEWQDLIKRIKNHQICQNFPKDSEQYQIQLKEDDLIVMGTDGLFDNLFKKEILQIIKETMPKMSYLSKEKQAKILAEEIVKEAKLHSVSKLIYTPFQKYCKQKLNYDWNGGKNDDITVICAWVVKAGSSDFIIQKSDVKACSDSMKFLNWQIN